MQPSRAEILRYRFFHFASVRVSRRGLSPYMNCSFFSNVFTEAHLLTSAAAFAPGFCDSR